MIPEVDDRSPNEGMNKNKTKHHCNSTFTSFKELTKSLIRIIYSFKYFYSTLMQAKIDILYLKEINSL